MSLASQFSFWQSAYECPSCPIPPAGQLTLPNWSEKFGGSDTNLQYFHWNSIRIEWFPVNPLGLLILLAIDCIPRSRLPRLTPMDIKRLWWPCWCKQEFWWQWITESRRWRVVNWPMIRSKWVTSIRSHSGDALQRRKRVTSCHDLKSIPERIGTNSTDRLVKVTIIVLLYS